MYLISLRKLDDNVFYRVKIHPVACLIVINYRRCVKAVTDMKHHKPSRIRDTVYVVGAGFSKGLGD
jgi:hypothetical protein